VQKVGQTPARCGHSSYHRHPQQLGKLSGIDKDAFASGFIHHVQSQHQRALQAHQFKGEFKTAAQQRCVNHVDDDVGLACQEVVSGFPFGGVDGGQRIDPRQINAGEFLAFEHHMADCIFHRSARKVGDRSFVAAEIIKNGTFAAVGLADEGYNHGVA
jgi:hypothetical protein